MPNSVAQRKSVTALTTEYYDKVLRIMQDYIGPTAGRFIDRQIRLYLRKTPHNLERSDIPTLALRIRSGLMVLMQDEQKVHEAFHRINRIHS
jgi:hypothetical protein